MIIKSNSIAALSILLILVGCSVSETTPPGDIKNENLKQNTFPDKPENTKNTLRPNPLLTPIQKFYDEWSLRYDSNLSPSQHAYCLAHSNKKSFTVLKDWIFLVNEEPRKKYRITRDFEGNNSKDCSVKEEALAKRRIGLGVTGLADALATCGSRFGSAQAVHVTRDWTRCLRRRRER